MQYDLSTSDAQRLQAFHAEIRSDYERLIGYPTSTDISSRELQPFLDIALNNVGDPYVAPRSANHSKAFEREVVAFFADLFRAPADDFWGYVTNGGTEGNLYALYVARERYPNAVAYYSHAAHYSVPKSLHLLGVPAVAVATQPSGEIDYAALKAALSKNPQQPAIVVANIGTTMTEAKDSVLQIKRTLQAAGTTRSFIHSDGALAAPYAALLQPRHPFDFADGSDSIAVSGHKFIGSPMPCGVIIVRKQHQVHLGKTIAYIGTLDTTISGSRNGHTPILLWCAIKKYGRTGLRRRAQHGLKLARYTHGRLRHLGWPAWRNPGALTVMLATPPPDTALQWQFASTGGWSHLICMPGLGRQQVDAFLAELQTVTPPPWPNP